MSGHLEKILNCPYCGKNGDDIVYLVNKGISNYVYCDNCGAKGINMLSEFDAIKYWNEIAELKLRRKQ